MLDLHLHIEVLRMYLIFKIYLIFYYWTTFIFIIIYYVLYDYKLTQTQDFGITNVNPFFQSRMNIGTRRKPNFVDTPLYEEFPEVSQFPLMADAGTIMTDASVVDTDTGGIEDLKTTAEGGASPDVFTRTITNLNYHLQAAHYLQGTGATNFIFVVIEKVFPYNIGVYKLENEFLDYGYELQEQALLKISEATTSGKWLGYTDTEPHGIQTLGKPYWLGNNYD